MDWVLDHIQVIILVAGSIAYYLNQRRREKQGMPADYDEDGIPDSHPQSSTSYDPATMEAEEAKRTRTLQEELRRKREQRERGLEPPQAPLHEGPARPPAAPPPVPFDPMQEMMKEFTRRLTTPKEPTPPPPLPTPQASAPFIDQEALARQRRLQERINSLDKERRAVRYQADALRLEASDTKNFAQTRSARDSLATPDSLRRTIIATEILGKPLSLR